MRCGTNVARSLTPVSGSLFAERLEELPRAQERQLRRGDREEVGVSAHDSIGFYRARPYDEVVVCRIARYGFGQLGIRCDLCHAGNDVHELASLIEIEVATELRASQDAGELAEEMRTCGI